MRFWSYVIFHSVRVFGLLDRSSGFNEEFFFWYEWNVGLTDLWVIVGNYSRPTLGKMP